MKPYDAYTHWITTWSDMQAHVTYIMALAKIHPLALELGVRSGVSTSALLTGVSNHKHGHVWSVDHDDCSGLFADCHQWTFIQADSCDFTKIKASGLPDRLDMLFIDTDHSEDRTYQELSLYGPLVKPGGVILLHDAYDTMTFPGVLAACMRFCTGYHYRLFIDPDSYGLATIQVPVL